jgi:hypothetical protein
MMVARHASAWKTSNLRTSFLPEANGHEALIHTVPSGTDLPEPVPGTQCRATIIFFLRDRDPSPTRPTPWYNRFISTFGFTY